MSAPAVERPWLPVAELFGPTVQGEGPSTGQRAVFVRLSYCNLECRGCDTAYTWDTARFDVAATTRSMSPRQVAQWVRESGVGLVVVTGGEPLMWQERLLPLLWDLRDAGLRVEVETNGTITPLASTAAAVTAFNVSPKLAGFGAGMSSQRRIRPEALEALVRSGKATFKFVVSSPSELDEVAELAETHHLRPVWVMPEGTDAAPILTSLRELAPAAVARGWNVSTRLHILIWGDERGH